MKTILCFGDSNTWGYDPEGMKAPFPRRHPLEVRWTGVLARELGVGYRVIEEGQNGRTTVHEDPLNICRKGKDYLPACLESHKPIDLVILMLGTNDLKTMFNMPPGEIAAGAGVLARMILGSNAGPADGPPKLLLVCPPPVGDLSHLPDIAARMADGTARSAKFPHYYAALATALNCAYLNSQDIVKPSALDGLHLEAEEHLKLGRALADKVRELGDLRFEI
ncbi:lysophospholipase L1-like esterase [Prosthecobacter fusiformis]|uniref:Lysophospholipase L1-like esterase n=1 Tax=Prosthecobacter fusiformis TaxID=48464 RepID=A0A4R7RJP9_9BACT|nr:SGNH/GDSL hydrolase family protein [Prosthecobacter fusiformis]TDU64249.1 lysophospholipase L1-like esterase [Prosthecobacter fusiformis]